MSDEIDRAQSLNEDFQAYALRQQRQNREPACSTGTGCIDCLDEIPEERRKAVPGCLRCIECQSDFETRRPV